MIRLRIFTMGRIVIYRAIGVESYNLKQEKGYPQRAEQWKYTFREAL